MAPDFGAKIYGREDGGGVDPDVVEDVGTEGSDEGERMGIEIGDTGDTAKEVPFNKLFLWDPEFLAAVVNDGVLVWVAVDDEGTSGGSKKVREDVG